MYAGVHSNPVTPRNPIHTPLKIARPMLEGRCSQLAAKVDVPSFDHTTIEKMNKIAIERSLGASVSVLLDEMLIELYLHESL